MTLVGVASLTGVSKKALFTTKLHFFALYQQNNGLQTGLQLFAQ
ncbi:hypothetical protein [Rhodoferax antarcticus]|uniref:Uncharacterized protein n=1 Tax=Rhodoferax antarcticus ANT.BR TaxID=1111071 RepID=A0A1Q8YJJ5_9BURK|nr:hypothetical protein [Rhodoferax antarcticus]MCW2314103.1 hypothetical protein [Rhodoferax antarcticus]OLP08182.1 hypothetical protein BLL52_0470 [Rhodoferax antarcticus ANT.BR]